MSSARGLLLRARAADWALVGVVAALSYMAEAMTPFRQHVVNEDPRLSFPFKHNTVTTPMLYGVCLALAPLLYGGALLALRKSVDNRCVCIPRLQCLRLDSDRVVARSGMWRLANGAVLSHLGALASTKLITDSLKRLVGQPRPYFFAFCEWDDVARRCRVNETEAYASFLSGHASLSFAAMAVVSIVWFRVWEAGQRLRPRSSSSGSGDVEEADSPATSPLRGWVGAICSLPTLFAVWIAATRVQDYAHATTDVSIGAAVGLAMAALWVSHCFSELALRGRATQVELASAASADAI